MNVKFRIILPTGQALPFLFSMKKIFQGAFYNFLQMLWSISHIRIESWKTWCTFSKEFVKLGKLHGSPGKAISFLKKLSTFPKTPHCDTQRKIQHCIDPPTPPPKKYKSEHGTISLRKTSCLKKYGYGKAFESRSEKCDTAFLMNKSDTMMSKPNK